MRKVEIVNHIDVSFQGNRLNALRHSVSSE